MLRAGTDPGGPEADSIEEPETHFPQQGQRVQSYDLDRLDQLVRKLMRDKVDGEDLNLQLDKRTLLMEEELKRQIKEIEKLELKFEDYKQVLREQEVTIAELQERMRERQAQLMKMKQENSMSVEELSRTREKLMKLGDATTRVNRQIRVKRGCIGTIGAELDDHFKDGAEIIKSNYAL
ncbi:unnamed protein product [Cyprideis torosa]|uniref:Uncharacterized protein n=1 Tax=Cyprideis torosa TaxID=163714 RepID=A0A7R8W8J3_9CRUS|nr:unnamed protein product [Cyprideis torosa]CAG0888687.1 unnamed protein product [Cyprideis torosa]